jgi:hypothetical protein
MGFNRQLDIFVAILATVLTFLGCIFMDVPVAISVLISLCVLAGGLMFGRRFAQTVNEFWAGGRSNRP